MTIYTISNEKKSIKMDIHIDNYNQNIINDIRELFYSMGVILQSDATFEEHLPEFLWFVGFIAHNLIVNKELSIDSDDKTVERQILTSDLMFLNIPKWIKIDNFKADILEDEVLDPWHYDVNWYYSTNGGIDNNLIMIN